MKHLLISYLYIIMSLGAISGSYAQGGGPIVLKTGRIIKFQQLQGQPHWQQENIASFQQAYWRFNPDGSFIFAPANKRDDLYPLRGRFNINGNTLNFFARGQYQMGYTATGWAAIEGNLDFSSGSAVVSMSWTGGSATSARVNGIDFGNNSSSNYNIVSILVPVN